MIMLNSSASLSRSSVSLGRSLTMAYSSALVQGIYVIKSLASGSSEGLILKQQIQVISGKKGEERVSEKGGVWREN